MKLITVISTTILSVLLGTAAFASSQHKDKDRDNETAGRFQKA